MVTDETRRQLQSDLRARLRNHPIDKIAKAAKLPTVEVIRFMDGGEELADGDTITRLALALFSIDSEEALGTAKETCNCPACTIRRLLNSPGVKVEQISLITPGKPEPKPEDNTVTEGLDWNSMPRWFTPACAASSLVLSVFALAIAVRSYL